MSNKAVPGSSEQSALLVVVGTCLAVLVPMLLAPALPFLDVPNYLARLHVLGADVASLGRQAYAPSWALMPDLGVELLYELLQKIAGPEAVVKVSIVGSILIATASICRMQRILWGRVNTLAALSPVLLSGLSLHMGYVNYVLGVSIALTGLTLFLGWQTRLSSGRILALSLVATLTWLCHVAAFAVFGFLLAFIDFSARRRSSPGTGWPDWIRHVTRTAMLLSMVFGPGLVLSLLAEKQIGVSSLSYGGSVKLRFLLSPFVLTGGATDLPLWLVVVAMLLLSSRYRLVQVAPACRLALVMLAFLILVCPWQVGQAIDVDARMMMPLTAFMLAAVRASPRVGTSTWLVGSAALVLLSLARGEDLWRMGGTQAQEVATFRRLARELPIRSALLTVEVRGYDACGPRFRQNSLPETHLGAYAVMDRGIYTPLLFTGPGMQPLRAVVPPFPARTIAMLPPSVDLLQKVTQAGSVASLVATNPKAVETTTELERVRGAGGMPLAPYWPGNYQSLLVLNDGCGQNPLPARLDLVGSGLSFSLFRVHPPPA